MTRELSEATARLRLLCVRQRRSARLAKQSLPEFDQVAAWVGDIEVVLHELDRLTEAAALTRAAEFQARWRSET